jgi:hypothetical protein
MPCFSANACPACGVEMLNRTGCSRTAALVPAAFRPGTDFQHLECLCPLHAHSPQTATCSHRRYQRRRFARFCPRPGNGKAPKPTQPCWHPIWIPLRTRVYRMASQMLAMAPKPETCKPNPNQSKGRWLGNCRRRPELAESVVLKLDAGSIHRLINVVAECKDIVSIRRQPCSTCRLRWPNDQPESSTEPPRNWRSLFV